jgi:type IV secretory pathway TrbF-like protein
LDSDLVTFFNDKDAQRTIKEYEYLLNEKQSTLDNYIKYLDTACEFAKVDKVQVIEIVRNKKNSYKKYESITNILD